MSALPRISIVLLITFACSALAQQEEALVLETPDGKPAAQLGERLKILEEKVQQLQMEKSSAPNSIKALKDPAQSKSELGPAASKIYFEKESIWQLGMSSELFTYQEKKGAEGTDAAVNRSNVMSVSPTLGFRLHPRLVFNSQFAFENGGSESSNTVTLQKGQSIVTQAYVDWLSNETGQSGLRIGHQLIPVGWVNTRNEPTAYLSVLKPELERELIPSSWHENGLTYWVDRPRADVQFGIYNSIDASKFQSSSFIAGGRSQGQNAKADDVMAAVRINTKFDWFLLGGSMLFGNGAQGNPALRNANFNLAELHTQLKWRRFEFFGMLARGQVNDAEAISIVTGQTISQMARGYSAQLAYDLLGGDRKLWLFNRYSRYNLNEQVADGYNTNSELDKAALTYGLCYLPLPNLTFKVDYTFRGNAAGTATDELALGLGIVF
jgi:hypothetical protein